jgi:hypothetical protein
MRRASLAAIVALVFAAGSLAQVRQSDKRPAPAAEQKSPAESILENPSDAGAIVAHVRNLADGIQHEPNAVMAVSRLNELDAFLNRLPTDKPAVQEAFDRIAVMVRTCREIVAIRTVSLEVLMQKVRENPDDVFAVSFLRDKLPEELHSIMYLHPEEAAKKLADAKAVFAMVERADTSEFTKKQLARAQTNIAFYDKQIAYSLKTHQRWRDLIGGDAVPLVVEAWINGSPLTADDLRGKVVLLDFVVVGSDIDDEPWRRNSKHLCEWNEKYRDKGFVVISLTRYSNQRWDERAEKPVRVKKEVEIVPAADEQTMLAKYFQKLEIAHRLALQSNADHIAVLSHYVPMVLPHNVVIDRQGKVRLIRAGGGQEHVEAIGQMLEELLISDAAATP